ncbi:hypothetical protein HDE_04826 [Halotydeus destructor]|nr:hypothetical protein HDE_04826 [Halotydeus destructor]
MGSHCGKPEDDERQREEPEAQRQPEVQREPEVQQEPLHQHVRTSMASGSPTITSSGGMDLGGGMKAGWAKSRGSKKQDQAETEIRDPVPEVVSRTDPETGQREIVDTGSDLYKQSEHIVDEKKS